MDENKISEFIDYATKLKGYEKGEAQLFLERLFIAFGQKGIIEAEAELELQIKVNEKTKFCDLLWPGKVLIEMKTRGEKLDKHFSQAKMYWDNSYNKRTKYVILCNFNEFWIYNWNLQPDPLDKVPLLDLKSRWLSLAFLSPEDITPQFGNNRVEVTKDAADKIAQLFKCLKKRGVEPEKAQRFTLQCLVALFAEDNGLFPQLGFFAQIIDDCLKGHASSYDLVPLLFQRMNSPESAPAGRFKNIRYFDGGIFQKIDPIELTQPELELLKQASDADWSKVQPSIFGNIFEDSLTDEVRHTSGAHYTSEADIMRIVEPTILRPWREKISAAKTLTELNTIRDQLAEFRVLDPACGSGNFLYISFRELKHLELDLLQKIIDSYPSAKPERLHSSIKSSQFFGIDENALGIELAKITLSMAKKFAADNFNRLTTQNRLVENKEDPLPFDNLDENLIAADALFIDWPYADAIIGNPPYQSKNKMQDEYGPAYINKLHEKFPDMPGRADYCVYWFRKAHDSLKDGGRAGLVGTNTIRQTYSREGGLDYIVKNNGVIVEAVGTMPWSGHAVVHVSIVNWIKSQNPDGRKRRLAIQSGERKDGPWQVYELQIIPSSLSHTVDVTSAKRLVTNIKSGACYQGQTHGHEGFLMTLQQQKELIKIEPEAREITFPYLIADELIGSKNSQPSRFVIDFQPRDIYAARKYKKTFNIIEENVLPTRTESYEKEKERNSTALRENPNARVNHHHENFFRKWWLLSYGRSELISKLNSINRYIVCSRVTKRPIFEFISSAIRPNDSLNVFPLYDDYSFGIFQSYYHWLWFMERCSTLKSDFRYTSDTVFDTFPWPQWGTIEFPDSPSIDSKFLRLRIEKALDVAKAARNLRQTRNKIRQENHCSLRDLYRGLELPGDNPLRTAQEFLDRAVREAYLFGLPKGMQRMNGLMLLLELNGLCATSEVTGKTIVGPGLPDFCKNDNRFISDDCIQLQ
jgi:type I restriction-modification system DNA methylase subunit